MLGKSRILRILLMIQVQTLATPVLGESKAFKQALASYKDGAFETSIEEMQKALAQSPGRSERARIFKYIGLSSYIMGRRSEAKNHFTQCLTIDSACRVERRETPDPTVLVFFRDVRKRHGESRNALKPQTRLLIKSPIDEAEVLVDGVVIGPVNISHDTEPGVHDLLVRAKGFRPRRERITINKMVENIYDIDLDKAPGRAARRERERARQERLGASDEGLEEISSESTEMRNTPAPAPPPAPLPELTREPVSIAHFLPFGIGQFYNGDYLLGSLLLGAQAFAIQVIVVDTQDIATAKRNALAASAEAAADPTIPTEDVEIYLARQQELATRKQKEINLTIGIAAGSYVFGVLHAISTRPQMIKNPSMTWQLLPTPRSGLQLAMNWNL